LPKDQSNILHPKMSQLVRNFSATFQNFLRNFCHKFSATFGFFERNFLGVYLVDSDQSCIANLHCKKSFSNSIKLAFGEGLCCLNTSSSRWHLFYFNQSISQSVFLYYNHSQSITKYDWNKKLPHWTAVCNTTQKNPVYIPV